jgi:hypothetical protein
MTPSAIRLVRISSTEARRQNIRRERWRRREKTAA